MVVSGEMYNIQKWLVGGAKWLLNVLVALQYAKSGQKLKHACKKKIIIKGSAVAGKHSKIKGCRRSEG